MSTFLVHWLNGPTPPDSKGGMKPIAVFCSEPCIAGWEDARNIDVQELRVLEVASKPRSVCVHCNHCGQRLHLPKDGYCNVHGRAGCPRAVFEVTTAAQVFAWLYVKRTRQAIPDKAWVQARRLWELGWIQGPLLAYEVRRLMEEAQ